MLKYQAERPRVLLNGNGIQLAIIHGELGLFSRDHLQNDASLVTGVGRLSCDYLNVLRFGKHEYGMW